MAGAPKEERTNAPDHEIYLNHTVYRVQIGSSRKNHRLGIHRSNAVVQTTAPTALQKISIPPRQMRGRRIRNMSSPRRRILQQLDSVNLDEMRAQVHSHSQTVTITHYHGSNVLHSYLAPPVEELPPLPYSLAQCLVPTAPGLALTRVIWSPFKRTYIFTLARTTKSATQQPFVILAGFT